MSLFQVKSSVLLPLLQSLGRPQPLLTETVGGKKLFPSSDDTDNTVCSTVLNLPNLEIIGLLISVLWNSIIYQLQEIFDKYLQTDSIIYLCSNFHSVGFLFGYEDELACLGSYVHNDQPTDIEVDDDWDNWDRRKRSVPNYRDPSGKCLWGVLRDLNNTEHETVR